MPPSEGGNTDAECMERYVSVNYLHFFFSVLFHVAAGFPLEDYGLFPFLFFYIFLQRGPRVTETKDEIS